MTGSEGNVHRVEICTLIHRRVLFQVAHEVYSGAMNKEAERLSGQLAAFKSDIKHDVRLLDTCIQVMPGLMFAAAGYYCCVSLIFCAFLQVDKLTANQKLDLNLERGRLRDDLQLLRDKLTTLRTSLEREVCVIHFDLLGSA